jgi:hypothetical protein
MKSSDPLLLADGTLHCGMYPAGKVAIFQHLNSHPRVPLDLKNLSICRGLRTYIQKYLHIKESRIPVKKKDWFGGLVSEA